MIPTIIVGVMITQFTAVSRIDAIQNCFASISTQNFHLKGYFVLGKGVFQIHLNMYPANTIVLDIRENMNEGKTLAWIRYAVHMFHDVPYHHLNGIVKMDTDVSVDWQLFSSNIFPKLDSHYYIGFIIDHNMCGGFSYCPPENCHDFSQDCWVYTQGGWYGLSYTVAKMISFCEYATENARGHEDLMVGKWIKNCNFLVSIHGIKIGDFFMHSKFLTDEQVRNGTWSHAHDSV
jgi:hypothetical protein